MSILVEQFALLSLANTNFILAQVVGVITAIFAVVAAQQKEMKPILVLQVLTNAAVVINYLLLGEMSGAWTCLVAIAQTVWIYFYTQKGKEFPRLLNFIFMVLYTIVAFLTYKKPYDLLAWAGAISYALGVAQLEPKRYRLIMVFNATFWIIYDLFTKSYTMAITHTFILLSIVIGIVRLDLKRQEE